MYWRVQNVMGHFVTTTANLLMNLTVKQFWKSVNIWLSYGQSYGSYFFDLQCITYISNVTEYDPCAGRGLARHAFSFNSHTLWEGHRVSTCDRHLRISIYTECLQKKYKSVLSISCTCQIFKKYGTIICLDTVYETLGFCTQHATSSYKTHVATLR